MDITDEGDDVEEAEDLSIKPCQEPGSPSSQGENVSSMLGLLINKFGFSNIQVRLFLNYLNQFSAYLFNCTEWNERIMNVLFIPLIML